MLSGPLNPLPGRLTCTFSDALTFFMFSPPNSKPPHHPNSPQSLQHRKRGSATSPSQPCPRRVSKCPPPVSSPYPLCGWRTACSFTTRWRTMAQLPRRRMEVPGGSADQSLRMYVFVYSMRKVGYLCLPIKLKTSTLAKTLVYLSIYPRERHSILAS